MDPAPDLATLLQRASEGDEGAAEELLKLYGRGMLRAVRHRLNEKLRRDVDSADFTQAVWKSFFANPIDPGKFPDSKALGAYLALLGERKVQEFARRENTQKRGAKRRQPLDSMIAESDALADCDPTPSQHAVAAETWQQLLDALSPRDRRILELRYQGHTNVEIGEIIGLSESTVRYVMDRLREKAKGLQ